MKRLVFAVFSALASVATLAVPCAETQTITMMSFNIRIGCGISDPFKLPEGGLGRLPQCAEVIKAANPDWVAIQEIDRGSLRVGHVDQTAELARLCGMHGTFVSKKPERDGEYGLAILSKEKPLEVSKVLMPGSSHTRCLEILEFRDYFVACTHFPLKDEYCVRAAEIVRVNLANKGKPVFLAGDFNSRPESEAVAVLKKGFTLLSDGTSFTWRADRPSVCIDYIFVDTPHAARVKVLSRKTIAAPEATDHCALVVKAELVGETYAFQEDFAAGDQCPDRKNVTPKDVSLSFGASFGGKSPCLVVKGDHPKRQDTAWRLRTKARPLPKGGAVAYRFSFEAAATEDVSAGGRHAEDWYTGIAWLDKDGKTISFDQVYFLVEGNGEFQEVVKVGAVPGGAVSYAVQFGFDWPNVFGGNRVAFRDARLLVSDKWMPLPPAKALPDLEPPRVELTSPTPFEDPFAPVAFSVTDASGVHGDSVAITIDGKDVTAQFARNGNSYAMARPDEEWTVGIHTACVAAVDVRGRRVEANRYFARMDPARGPRIQLRRDGMAVVGGKPFFPIGPYSLQKDPFNSNSFFKAFADLRAVGMNFAQRYGCPPDDFLDAAGSNGCMVLVRPWPNDNRFVPMRRHHPAVLAWYLADDTNRHFTPESLASLHSFFKALDGNHLTAQADEVSPYNLVSNYGRYVPWADVFLAEIYPLRNDVKDTASYCVPATIRDMKRSLADVQAAAPGRPIAMWPILQHFHYDKSAWCRYPTPRELKAMTFACICHGANGVLYYTYRLKHDPEKKIFQYGIISSPESWAALTDTTKVLGSIYDVLTAESCVPVAPPKILSGPAKDCLDNASISAVVKKWNGAEWLIAVNSTLKKVRVQFRTDSGAARADVWREDRALAVEDGIFVDDFEGHDVHIYRLTSRK